MKSIIITLLYISGNYKIICWLLLPIMRDLYITSNSPWVFNKSSIKARVCFLPKVSYWNSRKKVRSLTHLHKCNNILLWHIHASHSFTLSKLLVNKKSSSYLHHNSWKFINFKATEWMEEIMNVWFEWENSYRLKCIQVSQC